VVVADSSSDDGDDGGDDGGGASGGMPELHPIAMLVSPLPATQNEEVRVMVGVINAGDAPSGSFTMQWWQSSNILGCSWTVDSLAPGESANKSCHHTYGGWSVGYNIRLVVDSGNTVTETNEGNNSMENKLKVNKAP
jgi:subtilase family serine protease